jgi:hypothetical protein
MKRSLGFYLVEHVKEKERSTTIVVKGTYGWEYIHLGTS